MGKLGNRTFILRDLSLASRFRALSGKFPHRSALRKKRPSEERLIAASMVTILIVVFSLLSVVNKNDSWRIVSPDSPDFSTTAGISLGKRDFLRRLTLEHSRRHGAQINYVADIIRGNTTNSYQARRLASSIVLISHELDYDPLLVAAVIKYESTFRNHAVSPVGAVGLMQLLPTTAQYISRKSAIRWHGQDQLHNPDYNIRLGISYLKYLEKHFSGNRQLVLAAYNWGPGNVKEALRNKRAIPGSTLRYARNIIQDHQRWAGRLAHNSKTASSAVFNS